MKKRLELKSDYWIAIVGDGGTRKIRVKKGTPDEEVKNKLFSMYPGIMILRLYQVTKNSYYGPYRNRF